MKTPTSEATRAPRVADGVLELIGETPLLRLRRYAKGSPAELFAKLEYLNPGGSVKDRAPHAARECARGLPRGALVVTLFPDAFERCLGKGVFENL